MAVGGKKIGSSSGSTGGKVASSGSGSTGGKSRSKSQSKSRKAGVVFPVGRISRHMKAGRYARRIGTGAPIFMAAVLEYMTAEVLELASKIADDQNKCRIIPRHVFLAIRTDEELNQFLGNVIIASGGAIENVHEALFPKPSTTSGGSGTPKGKKKSANSSAPATPSTASTSAASPSTKGIGGKSPSPSGVSAKQIPKHLQDAAMIAQRGGSGGQEDEDEDDEEDEDVTSEDGKSAPQPQTAAPTPTAASKSPSNPDEAAARRDTDEPKAESQDEDDDVSDDGDAPGDGAPEEEDEEMEDEAGGAGLDMIGATVQQ